MKLNRKEVVEWLVSICILIVLVTLAFSSWILFGIILGVTLAVSHYWVFIEKDEKGRCK